ncbi:ornithine cyclodeaminase family protein [Bacilliculturomica massiliensis]|uniref:ornithine cyclodeaminase family protein n=1 Tax=Bacilliculturomica massiliensis TaxID=1917867 RepID=UPI00102FFB28|nr:ornithine cyclodeaminase family protein [Bacilliculturomica massiliensis]
MNSVVFMNGDEVRKRLSMKKAIEWMEEAFVLFSKGEADVFPIITHDFEGKFRNMDIKSGHLDGADVLGLKLLVRVMDNPEKRGLQALNGLVVIVNSKTGQLEGIVDGLSVTNIRTGACGGAAAKLFARKDSKHAVIVGAGYQGGVQYEGLVEAVPALEKVTIVDLDEGRAAAAVQREKEKYPHIRLCHAGNDKLPELLRTADILTTCTPSARPFIKKEWIRPGLHINAIGADMKGKQELDPEIMQEAHIFADSRKQVLRLGESELAYEMGSIAESDVNEIGDVLAGKAEGRRNAEEITVFDATGMAIEDLIVGARLLKV